MKPRHVLLLFLLPLPLHAAPAVHWMTVSAMGGQSGKTWHGQAKVRAIEIELGRTVSPKTDLALAITPLTFDQPRNWFGDLYGDGNEDVHAMALALRLRRKLNAGSARVQIHGDVSSGPMWSQKPVPAATSHFNFVTQFGAGVTILPASRLPVVAGYRFLHISNGGYSPRNPGLNVSSIVVGVKYRTAGGGRPARSR